jgi:hypothetical protein|tara:strand:- start:2452 stop:2856 length:405 start_codon:yes stop_codon:yes gene_type:complete
MLKTVFKSLLGDASKIIDDVVTTEEEKLTLKLQMKQMIENAKASAQEQVTRRWEADAKAGWLPANIRPLTLAFLTIMLVVMSFFDGNVGEFKMNPMYGPIYTQLLLVVYSAYFAGRSIEKIKNNNNNKIKSNGK